MNLVEERIDLAIRITNELDPNLIARPLGHCDSVVCASPAYLAAHGAPASVQDLAPHNCLTYSYFGKSLWQFERGGERVAVPVSGNLSANESQVLLAAAIEGAGIAMQPAYSARGPIAQGRLVALLPDFVPQGLGVYGVYASRRRCRRRCGCCSISWWRASPSRPTGRRGALSSPARPRGRARARNPTA